MFSNVIDLLNYNAVKKYIFEFKNVAPRFFENRIYV